MDALADKLRGRPVEMEVDAVAVIQRRIRAAEAEARDHRKFLAGLRVEIGVAAADVYPDETDTEIGKASGIISAARDIAEHVGHEIIDAEIPFQLAEVIHV